MVTHNSPKMYLFLSGVSYFISNNLNFSCLITGEVRDRTERRKCLTEGRYLKCSGVKVLK